MSAREWLVHAATAKGYRPTDDDTDTDLVWVIRHYRRNISSSSRRSRHAYPGASKPTRRQHLVNAFDDFQEMLAVLG